MPHDQFALQEAAANIADAFETTDSEHLAKLTIDERAIQAKARWALYHYVDRIWDAPHLREHGKHPNNVPGFEGVAALRDLLGILTSTADDALGEEIDTVSVKMVVERDED
jgi:hypothetical protein